jgi:hypothetical protein
MVQCNRAIYRGYGLKSQTLGGFEAVLTAKDDCVLFQQTM